MHICMCDGACVDKLTSIYIYMSSTTLSLSLSLFSHVMQKYAYI